MTSRLTGSRYNELMNPRCLVPRNLLPSTKVLTYGDRLHITSVRHQHRGGDQPSSTTPKLKPVGRC